MKELKNPTHLKLKTGKGQNVRSNRYKFNHGKSYDIRYFLHNTSLYYDLFLHSNGQHSSASSDITVKSI